MEGEGAVEGGPVVPQYGGEVAQGLPTHGRTYLIPGGKTSGNIPRGAKLSPGGDPNSYYM